MARAAPAATRAASILAFLTANPSRGFRISELAEHLGMNLASAHATLAVLCDAGFLLRDPVHRTYVLGPALAVTGFAALEQHPAVEAAIEQAEVLANELSAEIGVTAIAGRDVIFLARRGGPPALATSIGYPGDRSPLLAPIGAIFMAWADDDAVHEWLARAELPPLLASSYREILGEIRERGFSVPLPAIGSPAVHDAMTHVRSEPTDPGAERHLADVLQQSDEMLAPLGRFSPTDEIVYKTVAAPIFDPLGRVLLSLSITGPDYAVTVDEVLRLGHRLAQAATIATRHVRGRASGFEAPMGTAVSGGIHVTTTRVGFIGVGSQGGPMARRIVEEGFPLTLWARRPDSLAPYADTDTEIAATPAELGAASDLVGICVVADADVEDVLLRPDGVLAGMAPGGLIAIHATIHPETCRRLADAAAERGVAVVDAPVSGGGHMAAVRKLLVMVGGAADDVARIRPVFETFADPIIHLGPLGSGQVAKLLNNFVFTAQIAVSLDTYSFAQDLGVDRSALAQVLAHGSGGSTVAGIIAGMNFDLAGMAQVAAGLLRKDVGLTLDVARGAGAVPPAALVGLTDDALAAIDSA